LKALLLLLSLLTAPLPAAEATRAELRSLKNLQVSLLDKWRTVLSYRPAGTARVPLVIALHGGGGKAEGMAKLSGFTALAQAEGFAVLYPDSGVKAWNDGRPDPAGKRPTTDDSAWIAALAQNAVNEGWADPKRLYVCGISNGGFMSLRLACDHADLFAAVGTVSASGAGGPCPEGPPVPLCFIVGTADPIVPFTGGPIRVLSWTKVRGEAIPFETAFQLWRGRNRGVDPSEETLPDLDPKDGTRVRRRLSAGGPGGADTMAYIIDGGGHAWPGGWPYLRPWVIGRTSKDLDATRALWNFFRTHPKK
jgi:polyhydroxybutyrate depolymerase